MQLNYLSNIIFNLQLSLSTDGAAQYNYQIYTIYRKESTREMTEKQYLSYNIVINPSFISQANVVYYNYTLAVSSVEAI